MNKIFFGLVAFCCIASGRLHYSFCTNEGQLLISIVAVYGISLASFSSRDMSVSQYVRDCERNTLGISSHIWNLCPISGSISPSTPVSKNRYPPTRFQQGPRKIFSDAPSRSYTKELYLSCSSVRSNTWRNP